MERNKILSFSIENKSQKTTKINLLILYYEMKIFIKKKYEKIPNEMDNNKFIKNIDFDWNGFIMCLCQPFLYRVT